MKGVKAELPLQQQMKFVMKRLCFSVVCLLTIIPANKSAQARKGLPTSAALVPNGDAVARQAPSSWDNIRRTRFLAQITPDGTLPTVVKQQENIEKITGGEREGNNLFHSFEEFSIPEGIEAIFENGLNVKNIFTRITGESASTINGILKTQGSPNFFLVNPNGIVFGENAQLDVGGSFIATTADNIQFEDGIKFAAKNDDDKPILTVSVPIGLGFAGNSGAIQVNGVGNQIINVSSFSPIEFNEKPKGLSVSNGQTFALVGNGLNFNGGIVITESNQIYLGSVNTGSVAVEQTETGLILLDDVTGKYQDINLSERSLINFSGKEVGTITLLGHNINIVDGSFILSQNQGNSLESSINIKSSETLTISDTSSNDDTASYIRSETFDDGTGASINISANQLFLEGGRIQTNTSSNAMAGSINIEVSNITKFNRSFVTAPTFAKGDAGNINLSTSQLQLTNSGLIVASTIGEGNGGQVTVEADSIDVIGNSLGDNSAISAASFGTGNAGTVKLDTKQLSVTNGGVISSSSFGTGNAGNLTIDASEFVRVIGANNQLENSRISSFVESAPTITRQLSGLPEITTGNSGSLTINTPSLNVSQKGIVSVENKGIGSGGTLSINADRLSLYEAASITAATESGRGGNIDLNTSNLQIGTGSQVTAEANNDGDGGNISINTATLIAKKNSEVTANAFAGQGGNLDIQFEGLLVFDSLENIFSASSELGIDGGVNINTTINFSSFEPIKPKFIVAEEALQGSCFARRNSRQGSFVYGGAGGLPVSPSSAIDEESSLSSQLPEVQPNSQTSRSSDLGSKDNSAAAETVIYPTQNAQKWQVGEPIIEPTNLIKTADGRLLWIRKQADNALSLICQ